MVYDVRGGKGDGRSHVLELIERSFEVHVFDVGPGKACPWRADGAVPEELGRYHVGGACGQLKGVVDEVPAIGDADTVGILLLWLMVDDNMSTCDGPVFGDALDFVVGKKTYDVSHLGNTGLALGQAM